MACILAFDTSTETCSVGLVAGDRIIVKHRAAASQHAEVLLPMIDQVLAEGAIVREHLQAIAVVAGPGSFIGVRTAICTAQALAFALSIPVISLSSLAVLAQSTFRHFKATRVIAAWDARMNALYWGTYELCDGVMKVVGEDRLSPCDQLSTLPWPEAIKVGNAWRKYALVCRFSGAYAHDLYPTPEAMLDLAQHSFSLGKLENVMDLEPLYLRKKVAKTLLERKKHR